MTCATCQHSITDEARYCDRCGAPVLAKHIRLILEQGMTPGRQYMIAKDEVLIGRASDDGFVPDIDLYDQNDGTIHRRHATIVREGDKLAIVDGGNTNPVILNNRFVPKGERQELLRGDRIRLGSTVLIVQ